jgi:glycosyltransferase involved in cell wall biosynthesis
MKPTTQSVFKCVTTGHWLRDWKAIRCVAEGLQSDRCIEFHVVTNCETGLEGLPNVFAHRDIDDVALLALYQQADALFLPLTQSTANNSLLEGIACGLPVISTNLPAVQAYLSGKEAILVKENDPKELAEAILYLINHPTEREIMSQEARKRALELDWRNIAREYEAVYSEMVGQERL